MLHMELKIGHVCSGDVRKIRERKGGRREKRREGGERNRDPIYRFESSIDVEEGRAPRETSNLNTSSHVAPLIHKIKKKHKQKQNINKI